MPANSTTFHITWEGVTERRGELYASRVPGVGVVGYGVTVEEAQKDAQRVLFTLLDSIYSSNGIDAALARLTRAGIDWRPATIGHWESSMGVTVNEDEGMLADELNYMVALPRVARLAECLQVVQHRQPTMRLGENVVDHEEHPG